MKPGATNERLMHLIDAATDDDYFVDAPLELENDDPLRVAATQRQIASALGAIVLLLVRRDEDVSDEWERY